MTAMVRWQGYSREQRSTVNSLFLTYAAALLGLQSSILLSKEVTQIYWSRWFIVAGGGALLSFAAGAWSCFCDCETRGRRLELRVTRPNRGNSPILTRSVTLRKDWGGGRMDSFQSRLGPSLSVPLHFLYG